MFFLKLSIAILLLVLFGHSTLMLLLDKKWVRGVILAFVTLFLAFFVVQYLIKWNKNRNYYLNATPKSTFHYALTTVQYLSLCLLLIIIFSDYLPSYIVQFLLWIGIVIILFIGWKFFRCQYCGGWVRPERGKSGIISVPQKCPHCGRSM